MWSWRFRWLTGDLVCSECVPLITNTYSWLLIVLDETGAGCRRPSRSLRPPPSSFPGGQSAAHAEVKWRAATSWKVDVMWFTAANTFFPPALSLSRSESVCAGRDPSCCLQRGGWMNITHTRRSTSLCVCRPWCVFRRFRVKWLPWLPQRNVT